MSSSGGFNGYVNVFSDGVLVSLCSPSNGVCRVFLNQGASIDVAADYPGSLAGGTGPAAACTLSTCSFTMTADATVSVAGSAAPFATVTTTVAGDGVLRVDGLANTVGSRSVKYLAGSAVHLRASPIGSSRFVGYSSGTGGAAACGSAASCTFTLNADASVSATFAALTQFWVTPASAVATAGSAAQRFTAFGTYSSAPAAAIAPGGGTWSVAPQLPSARGALGAAALGGKIYAAGGGVYLAASNALNEFDPATQQWTSRAPMLTARANPAVVAAAGQLYALGGWNGKTPNVLFASVESYDPATDTWTARAPMAGPRESAVAGVIDGAIYVAGGDDGYGPVSTLEAYDPAADAWTSKAPMPTARMLAGGGVVNGLFYVVGGTAASSASSVSTVEAYDPATNTWSAKASLPVPAANVAVAVADGVLYAIAGRPYNHSIVYAYDPVADAWSARTPLAVPCDSPAAASLNGVVYVIGGYTNTLSNGGAETSVVQTFVDGLRWSSSAPSVARVDQTGLAAPLTPGTATIVASVAGTTCAPGCPTFTVVGPTDMSLDAPVDNSIVSGPLTIGGWALNRSAVSGTGVDFVHIYAVPAVGKAIFVGAATYGESRPDIGALYGSQFTNSGFTLKTTGLAAGTYTIIAYARNALTKQFDASKSARVTLTTAINNQHIAIDTPTPGQTVTSSFEVGGWALDAGAGGTSGQAGIDGVRLYVQPQGAAAPGVFVGNAAFGIPRPDVGAIYGSLFTNAGFHFTITGMAPGSFTLNVYAHSSVSHTDIVASVPFTVSGTALMSIDLPSAESTIMFQPFIVAGWSIDRSVESTGQSGSGVDALHVYAFPNPGSGQAPIFLGVATLGVSRPDVAAVYGSRYGTSGYQLVVDTGGLTSGWYDIAVVAHSSVSGTFNNVAVVRAWVW